jgi:hypothetical protein
MVGWAVSDFPSLVYLRLEMMVKLWLIALVAANALRTRQQLRFFLFFWLACFAFYPVRGALFNYYLYGEKLPAARSGTTPSTIRTTSRRFCILQLSMALGSTRSEAKGPVRLSNTALGSSSCRC